MRVGRARHGLNTAGRVEERFHFDAYTTHERIRESASCLIWTEKSDASRLESLGIGTGEVEGMAGVLVVVGPLISLDLCLCLCRVAAAVLSPPW